MPGLVLVGHAWCLLVANPPGLVHVGHACLPAANPSGLVLVGHYLPTKSTIAVYTQWDSMLLHILIDLLIYLLKVQLL